MVKRDGGAEWVDEVVTLAVAATVSSKGGSKRCFHANSGLVWWGCWIRDYSEVIHGVIGELTVA